MFNTTLILVATLFSAPAHAQDSIVDALNDSTHAEEPGACCLTDLDTGASYCTEVTFVECVDAGGSHYGAGTSCADDFVECEVSDPDLGACCLEDTCIDNVTESECEDVGTWYYGSTCADVEAECGLIVDDLGACCVDINGDGVLECVDAVTNDWCSHNFGTWYAGMDCVAVDAECEVGDPDLGACCREDTCIDNVTESECKDVGTWYPGASCDDLVAECELDVDDLGACCLDDECIAATAEECWADEGAFYGPGSSCDDAFVECCDDDTGTTGPVDPIPAVSCSSTGGSRGGLHLMLPLALMGMAAGFRRREVQ